jgi:hypothetical protein
MLERWQISLQVKQCCARNMCVSVFPVGITCYIKEGQQGGLCDVAKYDRNDCTPTRCAAAKRETKDNPTHAGPELNRMVDKL